MPEDQDPKNAWITRILGVSFGPQAAASNLPAAIAAWNQALEAAGTQITALQKRLRAEPDPDLQDIAEFGLGAMTGSHKVKLQAALLELSPAPAPPQKAATTLRLIEAFTAHLAADPRIAACDTNPFKIPMSLRATLTPALDGLRAALVTP